MAKSPKLLVKSCSQNRSSSRVAEQTTAGIQNATALMFASIGNKKPNLYYLKKSEMNSFTCEFRPSCDPCPPMRPLPGVRTSDAITTSHDMHARSCLLSLPSPPHPDPSPRHRISPAKLSSPANSRLSPSHCILWALLDTPAIRALACESRRCCSILTSCDERPPEASVQRTYIATSNTSQPDDGNWEEPWAPILLEPSRRQLQFVRGQEPRVRV